LDRSFAAQDKVAPVWNPKKGFNPWLANLDSAGKNDYAFD